MGDNYIPEICNKKIVGYYKSLLFSKNNKVNDFISISKFLKNKYYLRKKLGLENLQLHFFKRIMDERYRGRNDIPNNKALEDFIQSDYLSNDLKEQLYSVFNNQENVSNDLLELLSSDKHFRDFSVEDIKKIIEELENILGDDTSSYEEGRLCYDYIDVIYAYLFELSGEGPIQFTLENDDLIPVRIIKRSLYIQDQVGPVNSKVLGEYHLLKIYKYIYKFYPEYADDFVDMVNNIRRITLHAFIVNYQKFINDRIRGVVIPYQYYNIYGYDNVEEAAKHALSENDLLMELLEDSRIKEVFNRLVNEYKEQLSQGVQR